MTEIRTRTEKDCNYLENTFSGDGESSSQNTRQACSALIRNGWKGWKGTLVWFLQAAEVVWRRTCKIERE
jgi:hypothetical protein